MNGDGGFSIIWVIAGAAIILLFWAIATANRFVKLKMLVRDSWANLDVALKRRYDLIPNLISTVKAYAAHEQTVFDQVAAARSNALAAVDSISQRAESDTELVRAVNLLVARVEAYPELRSADSFLELQRELVNTEDKIAAARRFYNANVRDYNILLASFPPSIIGKMGGHTPMEQYEIESIEIRNMPQLSRP